VCSCKLVLEEISETDPIRSTGSFCFSWLEIFGRGKPYEGNGKLKVVFTIHAGDETTRPLLLDNAPLVKIVWDKEKVKEEHLDSLYKILEKARPPPAPEIEPPAAIELPAEETKAKPRAEEVLDECPNEIISP
jgi:hypothetical protein